jgi:hypothetical protein
MQLDGRDLEVDEPPPYTPDPSMTGDTILEQGPARPFQRAPAPRAAASSPPQNPHWARVQSHVTSNPTGSSSTLNSLNALGESLFQQLRATLNPPLSRQNTGRSSWSGYPGQGQPAAYASSHALPTPNASQSSHLDLPPPRHPSSPMASTNSSDFARDFYAAGTGDRPRGEGGYAPPAGPPPAQGGSSSSSSVPNDGRPTTTPAVGHPLLKDGKLLVYPKNYTCDKCNNVGYKKADPLRPCKRCWNKYSKPFTGPLAYSFSPESASDPNSNFQRPLPHIPPPAPPPVPPNFSLNPPPAHFGQGGYMTNHHGGFYSPPTGIHPVNFARPAPGSVVYMAGDPRIGGRLCWRCNGKGNTSFLLLDRITCEVCGGIGRTFDH